MENTDLDNEFQYDDFIQPAYFHSQTLYPIPQNNTHISGLEYPNEAGHSNSQSIHSLQKLSLATFAGFYNSSNDGASESSASSEDQNANSQSVNSSHRTSTAAAGLHEYEINDSADEFVENHKSIASQTLFPLSPARTEERHVNDIISAYKPIQRKLKGKL